MGRKCLKNPGFWRILLCVDRDSSIRVLKKTWILLRWIQAEQKESKGGSRVENRTGQFIARRRKAIGLTQKELADRLGVTNKAVSKWETGGGMPDISVLQELSRVLEVSVDELLSGEYEEESHPEKRTAENGQPAAERTDRGNSGLSVKRIIIAGVLFLPLLLVICMQAAYLYVRRSAQFEYIVDWFPYLFFGIAVLPAVFGICMLVRNKKARIFCGAVTGILLVVLLAFGIYTGVEPNARKSVVSISPDGHMMVLKYEKSTGRVTTYQNQILWFARMSDTFPYTAEEEMKIQWLADDACAVTYRSPDDSQTHQYVMTYGDRGNGIYTYYVYNVIQGGWGMEGKNTAGWELNTGPEGITVVSPSGGEQTYEADDCVQFGTLAIALCKDGLPQWTLVLMDDCIVGDNTDMVESGTVALCKVTMEKSAPVYFTRTSLPEGADMDLSEIPTKEERGKELRDTMKEILKNDPTLGQFESDSYGGIKVVTDEEDIFWVVRCGIEERLKLFAVNGVDVDCQILHMELTAGDSYDCVVKVNLLKTFPKDSGMGEDTQAELEETYRVMKGEGAYLLVPVDYSTDPSVGLDAPAMSMERDPGDDENYHFFVPGIK